MKVIKEQKHFGYIYKLTMIPTGKIYIGKREKDKIDVGYYGSGRDWKIDLKKYGKENVKVEILDWADSRDELREKEVYWIKEYNSQNKEIGYNVHKGGAGGNSLGDTEAWAELHRGEKNGRYHMPVSQETRDKIGVANSGKIRSQETKDKISASTKGVPKPNGFGDKISAARKGVPNTWAWKSVQCIETGKIYKTVHDASIDTGATNIARSCKLGVTSGGYHWRYVNEN